MLTKDEIRERLKDHSETIEVEILGETYLFCLTTFGAKQLRKEGIEVVSRGTSLVERGIQAYEHLRDEKGINAEDLRSGNMEGITFEAEEVADLLLHYLEDDDLELLSIITYWGLRTFDDDVELEAVEMIPLGEQAMILPTIMARLFSFVQDETDGEMDGAQEVSDEAGDGDEGN